MKIEHSPRSADVIQALKRGDFVSVRLNAAPDSGFCGFVIQATADRVRLMAHEAEGRLDFTGTAGADENCLGLDVVVPMTSIAWIRHFVGKPADCKCREGIG